LNQIREGKIKRKVNDLLLQYVGRKYDENLVATPTKLYPTKNKVEQINNFNMSALNSDEKEYNIKYLKDLEMTKKEKELRLEFNEKDIQVELDFLAGNLVCDKTIKAKIGAQVMCVINIKSTEGDTMVCNGSQGKIVSYCEYTGLPRVKFNNGIEMVMTRYVWASDKIPGIGISQVPLILAWALTIHKSQGATLDAAEIDVGSGIFECGQTYVALSRVKSLDGLYLTSFDAKRIRINKKVKEFYEELSSYQQANVAKQEDTVQLENPFPNDSSSNQFENYKYIEASAELTEELYDEESQIKIIKIK
jgi:ATP-dependent DNA helicase PIF1